RRAARSSISPVSPARRRMPMSRWMSMCPSLPPCSWRRLRPMPDAWHVQLLAAARGDVGALGGWRRGRDLSVLTIVPGVLLVVACDSNGGIGPKPRDTVATSGYELGRLAVRVPLEEILACGATPLLLIDTLNVEREPTGAAILAGVRDEM